MSHEAEQSVIGTVMQRPESFHAMAAILDAEDFAAPEHRALWSLIGELIEAGSPVDGVTVDEIIGRRKLQAKTGGPGYATELASSVPGSASMGEAYAELVRDHAIRRRIRAIGQRLASIDLTGSFAIDEAHRLLGTVATKARAESVTIKQALKAVYERMEQRFSGVELPVVPTPWVAVNRMMGGGLGRGKLYIVGGRPGMGKTAWMRGYSVAATERGHVAVISLEMDREEVAGMMLAGAAGVSYQHIRDPRDLPGDDWKPITVGVSQLTDLPISICDVPALSLPAITAEVRRLHSRRKLSTILIDYLGLIDLPDADRQDLAIGAVTRGLKRLARDLDCAVVLLCQLSRKVEERSDKRPMLSDLRDAGQIEQDADGIIFLYRDKYYRPESQMGDVAEMIIAKQRGGKTGTVPVVFRGEQIEFVDYEGEWPIAAAAEKPSGPRGFGRKAA